MKYNYSFPNYEFAGFVEFFGFFSSRREHFKMCNLLYIYLFFIFVCIYLYIFNVSTYICIHTYTDQGCTIDVEFQLVLIRSEKSRNCVPKQMIVFSCLYSDLLGCHAGNCVVKRKRWLFAEKKKSYYESSSHRREQLIPI